MGGKSNPGCGDDPQLYFTKLRENSRFYHISAFYILRKKLLKIETELLDQGKLKCQGDIFFLKLHEITRMQTGQLGWPDVEERIHTRRLEHVRFSKMVPPKTIGLDLPGNSAQDDVSSADGKVLRGQSASPGSYEGIAHGMPCVVDVAECTKHIQTGARLHVDGDRGIVRILYGLNFNG